jgi:hypothetical protein
MSPTTFFNNYFLTPPYPAGLLWTTGLSPSGPIPITVSQESQWFSQVASLADQHKNIKIMMLIFVNLSGNSIITSTIQKMPGFVINRNASLTRFDASGLSPLASYNIVLQDYSRALFAPITSFTTDSAGAAFGNFAIPSTPNNGQPWYITVLGTGLYDEVALQGDQRQDLLTYVNNIKGHPSIVGAQFEPEYFGDAPSIKALFKTIVNDAGINNLQGDGYSGTNDPILYYSSYPFFGGVIPPVLSGNVLGIHYGETGTPACDLLNPCPIWTQSHVSAIVDTSQPAPLTIIIAEMDTGNSFTNYGWSSPTLRSWIANDAYYQANFLLANG